MIGSKIVRNLKFELTFSFNDKKVIKLSTYKVGVNLANSNRWGLNTQLSIATWEIFKLQQKLKSRQLIFNKRTLSLKIMGKSGFLSINDVFNLKFDIETLHFVVC